jgi:hypothetical protein
LPADATLTLVQGQPDRCGLVEVRWNGQCYRIFLEDLHNPEKAVAAMGAHGEFFSD